MVCLMFTAILPLKLIDFCVVSDLTQLAKTTCSFPQAGEFTGVCGTRTLPERCASWSNMQPLNSFHSGVSRIDPGQILPAVPNVGRHLRTIHRRLLASFTLQPERSAPQSWEVSPCYSLSDAATRGQSFAKTSPSCQAFLNADGSVRTPSWQRAEGSLNTSTLIS